MDSGFRTDCIGCHEERPAGVEVEIDVSAAGEAQPGVPRAYRFNDVARRRHGAVDPPFGPLGRRRDEKLAHTRETAQAQPIRAAGGHRPVDRRPGAGRLTEPE
jgi:hypothetical protein